MLLIVSACDPAPYPLHGDVTFTDEERAAIERANAFVAEKVGTEAVPIIWDLPHPDRADGGGELSITRGTLDPTHFGNTSGSRIELDPMRFGLNVEPSAAHEFGHFYGAHHHRGVGIMHPNGSNELVWTGADAACVRRRCEE